MATGTRTERRRVGRPARGVVKATEVEHERRQPAENGAREAFDAPEPVPQARTNARRARSRRLDYIAIGCVSPELDDGRFPVKRIVGDRVWVGADIFKEGSDQLSACIVYRAPGATEWSSTSMAYDYDSDRWFGSFVVDQVGDWTYSVEAWSDRFATWRAELRKKVDAGQDVHLELVEGAALVKAAGRSTKDSSARATLQLTAKMIEDRRDPSIDKRVQRVFDEDLAALVRRHARPTDLTRFRRDLTMIVDRPRARFASWYEMFPRSQTAPLSSGVPRHGTFDDAAARLPRVAELGFDVVYLPPIHPIGRSHRKGKNNSLTCEPSDVGSPWAIGNEDGGHTAVDPNLGTLDDFCRFVSTATNLDLEVALDYALQCSPDHPWVKEHPNWFHVRPDGSIRFAENPPKKYQDIVPLNFWCDDREALWNACRDVMRFWIERGVKTFRVDNPHTKPFAFWEWLIKDVRSTSPDVILFSEAFTRPKRMKHLAKLGFTMSYTFFTWKNAWWELRDYLHEMSQGASTEYFRGNLFANTPDILTEYLTSGGRPAFRVRALLAATMSSLYGIYSGFELCENVPAARGSEEYLHSEKYELRPRDYQAPGNINSDLARLNRIRRGERALQRIDNLSFHTSENPAVLFYRKAAEPWPRQWVGARVEWIPRKIVEGGNGGDGGTATREGDAQRRRRRATQDGDKGGDKGGDLLIAVNLDPHNVQDTMVHVPIHELGIDDQQPYRVRDLLTGAEYTWRGVRNYVRLDPSVEPGHILSVET